jgi:pimeloyl-ACP methyl ester carboxylesterase
MVFLHGFPEAAFIWDELLEYFAQPEHGGFRCIAPNLRGFEKSSSPKEVSAYRAHLLVQDVAELAATENPTGNIEVLVAHDWGGAFGWGYANQHADKLGTLVIINSPHPATFMRELLNNPAQQAASAYMNFLARPRHCSPPTTTVACGPSSR